MGEGVFKSALPLEKSLFMHFCCICHVLRSTKFIWEELNRPICYSVFFMLLLFSGLMYLVHAYAKITYFSYFFFSCIPTSEDLLETKQALFKHFPCNSTGMLQSVLLKRKERLIILVLCFLFWMLDSDSESNLCASAVMQTRSSCCLSHTHLILSKFFEITLWKVNLGLVIGIWGIW